MLIRFTVENFLSFNQRTDFNMIASEENSHPCHAVKGKSENEISLLRSSVVYGANASGKSNLIRAMAFAKEFVVEGVGKNRAVKIKPFRLDRNNRKKPARFEFEFRHRGKQYAYGYSVDKAKVSEEWLFEIGHELEEPIFERAGNEISFNFDHGTFSNIPEDEKQRLGYEARSTRDNLLFLTNCRERNIKYLELIYEWFDDILNIIFPGTKLLSLPFFISPDEDIRKFFNVILKWCDFGIKKISIEEIDFEVFDEIPEEIRERIREDFLKEQKKNRIGIFSGRQGIHYAFKKDEEGILKVLRLTTIRSDKNRDEVLFEIREESDGTRRVIDLIPILMALRKDRVFIVDEVENSLHPLLVKKLFDLVLNHNMFEGSQGQLIASTHEVHLLDIKNLFRKDEIWFIEKDRHGQSHAYSLANTNVEDLDLLKGYLNGRFGAIPFIRAAKDLGWEA